MCDHQDGTRITSDAVGRSTTCSIPLPDVITDSSVAIEIIPSMDDLPQDKLESSATAMLQLETAEAYNELALGAGQSKVSYRLVPAVSVEGNDPQRVYNDKYAWVDLTDVVYGTIRASANDPEEKAMKAMFAKMVLYQRIDDVKGRTLSSKVTVKFESVVKGDSRSPSPSSKSSRTRRPAPAPPSIVQYSPCEVFGKPLEETKGVHYTLSIPVSVTFAGLASVGITPEVGTTSEWKQSHYLKIRAQAAPPVSAIHNSKSTFTLAALENSKSHGGIPQEISFGLIVKNVHAPFQLLVEVESDSSVIHPTNLFYAKVAPMHFDGTTEKAGDRVRGALKAKGNGQVKFENITVEDWAAEIVYRGENTNLAVGRG